MSDHRSDLKYTPFVKSPVNTACALYGQYVHDLCDMHDRQVPLVSSLTKKDSADWLAESYQL